VWPLSPLQDTEDVLVLPFFDDCYAAMEGAVQQGHSVLVYCSTGMSRGATIAACYLMKSKQITAERALELVGAARPGVKLSDALMRQLSVYHEFKYNAIDASEALQGQIREALYDLEHEINEALLKSNQLKVNASNINFDELVEGKELSIEEMLSGVALQAHNERSRRTDEALFNLQLKLDQVLSTDVENTVLKQKLYTKIDDFWSLCHSVDVNKPKSSQQSEENEQE
jgi:hypothetical protein